MQAFALSGDQWFDQVEEPVLLLHGEAVSYYNGAAREVFRLAGEPLAEGGPLPLVLAPLAGEGEMAGEVTLGDGRWLVRARQLEAGRLFLLRPVREQVVFPNDRLDRLTQQLRLPLSSMLSAVELLARSIPEGDTCAQRYLSILNQNYCRLLRLLNHLDYARLLAGEAQEQPALQTLDFAGLFREVGRLVSSLGLPGEQTFSWQDKAGGLLVQGNSELLSLLLYQLVANAWRSGGDVTLLLEKKGGRAILTVSDTGGGMTRAALRDAFVPAAGQMELDRAGEGLGLGLPICQYIVALHGGTLLLDSREGRGLSVRVSLPVCAQPPAMEMRTASHAAYTTGGFPAVLVELSEVLPPECFQNRHLE